jgi:hypothetical protein
MGKFIYPNSACHAFRSSLDGADIMQPTLTYNDMLNAYQKYPAPIRPFLLRAETHPILRSQLTKSFMRVFIDVLGRAPIADPLRPLWLRIDMVADNLGISTKTVSRALRFMKKQAWLHPAPSDNGRNNWGQFGINKFVLGDGLRTLLGLPTTANHPLETTDDAATQPIEAETVTPSNSLRVLEETTLFAQLPTLSVDAIEEAIIASPSTPQATSEGRQTSQVMERLTPSHTLDANATTAIHQAVLADQPEASDQSFLAKIEKTEEKQPSETKMSDGVYIRVNKVFLKEASFEEGAFMKKAEPQNPNGKILHLPETLTPLQTELGIHPLGILKLMNLAKAMRQRLQDVWQAKRDQLLSSGATGGRAFHYLKFLLETGEDFAYRARNVGMKKPASAKEPNSAINASMPAIDHRRYWNKRFTGENGLQVRIHGDGSAAVTSATETNAYVRPADVAPIYEAIAAGRLWLLEE